MFRQRHDHEELIQLKKDRANEEKYEKELIKIARNRYCTGDLEIDDAPSVSYGDDGAFIQAWIWVSYDEVE